MSTDEITKLKNKLTAARATVARLEAQIAEARNNHGIKIGDDVDFIFGRAESKREMSGKVVGIADSGQGKLVAITVKDELGLPDIKRVNIKAISKNRTAERRGQEKK